MSYFAARERAALSDLALEVGADQPTLCGEWTVKDLMAHLVLRERNAAAVGIVVRPLAGVTDWAQGRLAREDFEELVHRFRDGAPVYSPFALKQVDKSFNALEFFIHHEDIRRAQPEWAPRELPDRTQEFLWRAVKSAGRGLVRKSKVGLVVQRSDTDETATLKADESQVVVRGLPGELALFVYGRKDQAQVELSGGQSDLAALADSAFGI